MKQSMVLYGEEKDAQERMSARLCTHYRHEGVPSMASKSNERVKNRPSLLPNPVPADQVGPPLSSPQPVQNVVPFSRQTSSRLSLGVLLLLVILPLIVLAGIIVWRVHPPATDATILVTAQEQREQQTLSVIAVTTSPASGQIQAHLLSATSSQQTTVSATGTKTIPAHVAHGTITFYNLASFAQTVSPHTVLTSSNGVQVETLAPVVVPPASVPSDSTMPLIMGQATTIAQAMRPGEAGNVAAHAVTTNCCGQDRSISARNEQAFIGGQDAASEKVIQQSDSDQAATILAPQALQGAKTALTATMKRSDQALDKSQRCMTTSQTTPSIGSASATVTVSVSATCHVEVYQKDDAESMARDSFVKESQRKLGPSFVLKGQPHLEVGQTAILDANQGTLRIPFSVNGLWIYQLDQRTLRPLLPQLAGKQWKEAQILLRQQPGVGQVTLVGTTSETLPGDVSHITLAIRQPATPRS